MNARRCRGIRVHHPVETPFTIARNTQDNSVAIQVREATAANEREAAFRLRFEIYVAEMNRAQAFADIGQSRIEDPWDAMATLFVAWAGHEPIGTIRYNRS
jgi:putative hemolysin